MHYIHEMKTSAVTATEANRSFSKLLRAVQRGERIEITSHGRTVAVLAPAESEETRRARQLAALEKLEKRWAIQKPIVIGPWTRDEIYERD
jgi:prevent-host-death family protein